MLNFVLTFLICMGWTFIGSLSLAETWSWNVTDYPSNQGIEVSSGVWNSLEGQFHPPLEIANWKLSSSAVIDSTPLELGDGRQGAFNLSTASAFGQVNGTVITINTNVYRALQVTSFDLPAGYTLRPVGDYPLIIRSLGSVTIHGTIDCSGEDGEDAQANPATMATGGSGYCGGGSGGSGAFADQLAVPGAVGWNTPAGISGGGPGGNSADITKGGGGGGGGGGFPINVANIASAGVDGAGSAGSAGILGTSVQDNPMVIQGGGAGGGGGGCSSDGTSCQNGYSGAGGGGGGGIIYIFSLGDIFVGDSGKILARGGMGGRGNGAGPFEGTGSGGNGGAGSIWMASSQTFTICSPGAINGTTCLTGGALISADAQSTGPLVILGGGGAGGAGAGGRVWVTDSNALTTGAPAVGSELLFDNFGSVSYRSGTFQFTTGIVDLANTHPTLNGVALAASLQGTSSVLVEIAGSNDNFLANDSGWFTSSQLSSVSGYRYVKARISLINDSAIVPSYITSVTLNYTGEPAAYFEFNGGCGRLASNGSDSWIVICLLIVSWLLLRRGGSNSSVKPLVCQ